MPNVFLVCGRSYGLFPCSVARFRCLTFDIQSSMDSIYSESRKKSATAQMLLVPYGSRNKELGDSCSMSHRTRALQRAQCCSAAYSPACAQAAKAAGLFPSLSAQLIPALQAFGTMYVATLNPHFPPFYFRSTAISQSNHFSTQCQKLGVRWTWVSKIQFYHLVFVSPGAKY